MTDAETALLKVFHNCPVAMSISRSAERTFVDVNAAFTNLLGWNRDEAVGRSAADLHIVDATALAAFRERLTDARTLRNEELTVRTRAGDTRVLLLGTELMELQGEDHVVTTFVDITDRKQVELSLSRIAAIVESSDDAIIGKDLHGIITSWNRAAEHMFGYAAAEAIGRPIMMIIPADRQSEERTILENVKQGTGVKHLETVRQTKDGRRIEVSITTSPIRDAAGRIVGVSKVARDIGDRKQSEEIRRALEARYQALFEHAPDGMLIADADSCYIDANASMCQMLGYAREEFIGLHASDIVVPAELDQVGPTRAAIKHHQSYRREWRFRRKDGSTLTAEVIGTMLPDGNVLGMIRDVTERKRLEQQILRAQRMESIGTLAGGIAHDLNNVLAPILLAVNFLKAAITDRELVEVLDMIGGSAQRGSSLVQQVLLFARGVEGPSTAIAPAAVAQELARVLRDTFPKSIEVRLTTADNLWNATGDTTQLHQVLLNLCVNARDAMPNGGQLTIALENVTLDETYAAMNLDARPGRYVLMQVVDTGAGIAPDVQERIFEPFFTTKEVGKGTGLGLSTTLAIIKGHGGYIHVYSEVGSGTAFKVYLPARSEADGASVSSAELAAPPRGNGEVVLVVDDEPVIRAITRRTLEAAGYDVMLASNGAEAVAAYAQHMATIAIVLTDMAMPVMGGEATIVALRSMNPLVKVICSSGVATDDAVARALGVGGRHFLAKPYTAETVLNALHEVLYAS